MGALGMLGDDTEPPPVEALDPESPPSRDPAELPVSVPGEACRCAAAPTGTIRAMATNEEAAVVVQFFI
jgi:hypothetical protein